MRPSNPALDRGNGEDRSLRVLPALLAAIAISMGLAGPAEAGKSRHSHTSGFFAVPGATRIPGFEHSTFSHRRHGSGARFDKRTRPFFRSDPFIGTIVPPLRGTIVPSFEIGRPFHHDRFFGRGFDGFFSGGVDGRRQTIVIVQPVLVPMGQPAARKRPIKPQVVELGTSSEATGVLVFTPTVNE
jgi:hypothetical protein